MTHLTLENTFCRAMDTIVRALVASSFTQLPTTHSINEIERRHGHTDTMRPPTMLLDNFVDNTSILSLEHTGCCVGVSVWCSLWSCVVIVPRCYCFYRSCVCVCVCISAVMCVGGVPSLCVCNRTDHVLFVCEHITTTQYPTVYTHTHSQLIRMTMRLCLWPSSSQARADGSIDD